LKRDRQHVGPNLLHHGLEAVLNIEAEESLFEFNLVEVI